MRTGKSETGLRACTYAVEVRTDPEDGVDKVWIESPEDGHNWRLVELRPVSEGISFTFYLVLASYFHIHHSLDFADPPPPPPESKQTESPVCSDRVQENIVPAINAPTTLMEWAVLILNTPNPTLKVYILMDFTAPITYHVIF